MARDGSGDYSRVEGPYVNGQVADADEINNELDDISSALSDSINKAGTKAFAADQSMGSFKLTDLAAPSAANDAARKAYVDSAITAAAQPLDATLTALAALSWSSGNPLVQFTAADTVSLTLTPSVTSVTVTTTTDTDPGIVSKNTADSASVRVARFEGDRATPATSDRIYIDFVMSDDAGNQDIFARLNIFALSVASGSEESYWRFNIIKAGVATAVLDLVSTYLAPFTNDALSLGNASQSWADLFLASGAVLNFNNGNFTLTHSAGLLTANGGIAADLPLSSETSGTLTAASRDKYLALDGAATLPNSVFGAGQWQEFVAGASSRAFTRGSGIAMYVNGVDSASATLAARGTGSALWTGASTVYLRGDFS